MADEILIPNPPALPQAPGLGRGKGKETIVIVRKARGDKLKPASSAEQRFEIRGCVVIPRASNEANKGWTQISGYTVHCPPGSDILAEDQVICRGRPHSVEGIPGVFRSRRGREKGTLVTLQAVT